MLKPVKALKVLNHYQDTLIEGEHDLEEAVAYDRYVAQTAPETLKAPYPLEIQNQIVSFKELADECVKCNQSLYKNWKHTQAERARQELQDTGFGFLSPICFFG